MLQVLLSIWFFSYADFLTIRLGIFLLSINYLPFLPFKLFLAFDLKVFTSFSMRQRHGQLAIRYTKHHQNTVCSRITYLKRGVTVRDLGYRYTDGAIEK